MCLNVVTFEISEAPVVNTDRKAAAVRRTETKLMVRHMQHLKQSALKKALCKNLELVAATVVLWQNNARSEVANTQRHAILLNIHSVPLKAKRLVDGWMSSYWFKLSGPSLYKHMS